MIYECIERINVDMPKQMQKAMLITNTQSKNTEETKKRLLKEWRILKVWAPNIPESEGGHNLPGYRYVLQQRVEFSNSKESKRIWNVIGEGSKYWAEANAWHYGIEVPEEEYILEDHQNGEDD